MSSFEEDVQRGRWDVKWWADRFLGIKLHPGQIRFANAYIRRHADTGWRPEFFDICLSAGNRAGKTLALAVVILHSCFYKMGTQPPMNGSDPEIKRWRERPYLAYHFAISQEVADLVYIEIVKMMQGMHEAQHDGCPLMDEFKAAGGEQIVTWDKKYGGDYRWIVFHELLGGAEIHFRTTGEKALGSIGRDMHLITFDECGLEANLLWIYENVLRHRRLGTGGQVIFVSTPEEGFTQFADFWFMGDPEAPDRKSRHMSLRMSTRDNIGYGLHQDVFDALVADLDADHVKQNIDGYFIQGRLSYFDQLKVNECFTFDLPNHQEAVDRHVYLQGVDPGLSDKCWSIVFDLRGDELFGVKAEYAAIRTTEAIVALAVNNHDAYALSLQNRKTRCATAIDTTGLGGHMFRQLVMQSIPDITSVEFGGNLAVKRKLLGDLKTMIEQGKLHMPREGEWLKVRRELLGFKVGDKHIDQDAVMALACVVKLVRRTPPDASESIPFEAFSTGEEVQYRNPSEWARKPFVHERTYE